MWNAILGIIYGRESEQKPPEIRLYSSGSITVKTPNLRLTVTVNSSVEPISTYTSLCVSSPSKKQNLIFCCYAANQREVSIGTLARNRQGADTAPLPDFLDS